MFDHQNSEALVLVPRESHPTGGVSSHLELLRHTLSAHVSHAYWHLPPVSKVHKALLVAKHSGDVDAARRDNVRRKVAQLEAQLRVRAMAWPFARLIHVHDVIAGLAAVNFRDSFGRSLPVLYTAHGPLSREIRMDTGDEELAEFIEQLEGKFYARLDRAIAVDTVQAEILSGDFGVPRGKITVIHNAVDVVNVGRPTPEFHVRRETAQRILVLPRRLVEKNGPLVALEALALLPPYYRLWVVGNGPLRSQFEARTASLGLEGRVRLWGEQPRSNVMELMRQADVIVVPSVPAHGVVEATSIAALEGMALGKPVVASAIGGLVELIQSGQTGLLVPPGDARALARAVLSLEQSDFGGALGRQAADFIRRSWSSDHWAALTYAEYQRLL